MAVLIPDWVWRILPDSMGGFISLAWVVLFWILRVAALRWSDNGSESPHRGLLCSAAALCGVVAITTGGLLLVALNHMQSFGILLAIVCVPMFLVSAVFSYMCYRGARDGVTLRGNARHSERSEESTRHTSEHWIS